MRLLVASVAVCAIALIAALPGGAQGSGNRPADLPDRSRGAERIVVGTVTDVQPAFETNEFGDRLIVSTASVRVSEVLKGPAAERVAVSIEGGTVGEITLEVSDMPSLAPGTRVVMFLESQASDRLRPHGRGRGVLEFDVNDRVRGTDMTLDEVKAAVAAGLR